LSASATTAAVAASAHKQGGQPQHQAVWTSKPPDNAQSLVAMSPFVHEHTGKRISSHLAGLEQGH
jgi:hypothetical protein